MAIRSESLSKSLITIRTGAVRLIIHPHTLDFSLLTMKWKTFFGTQSIDISEQRRGCCERERNGKYRRYQRLSH